MKMALTRLAGLTRDERSLVDLALEVRTRAYAPYSSFKVGAVLQTPTGKPFVGCNVENASYGATLCAERSALSAALAAGCRKFSLLVVAADSAQPITPCGICRQVLAEFEPDLDVILVNLQDQVARLTLSELHPMGFSKAALEENTLANE
jgi:cytidine deaminase